jgi:regulator of sigma D
MLLEEFYSYDASNDKLISEFVYVHTLSCWLSNNDFTIYEELLDYYEGQEQYAVCDGLNRALSKIDDIMAKRLDEADKIKETETEVLYTHQEHMRVSGLIFQDIIKEIYEKQIDKRKEDN